MDKFIKNLNINDKIGIDRLNRNNDLNNNNMFYYNNNLNMNNNEWKIIKSTKYFCNMKFIIHQK